MIVRSHYPWIQDTFKVMCDAGRSLELVGAWADITERKRAEDHALQAKRPFSGQANEGAGCRVLRTDRPVSI